MRTRQFNRAGHPQSAAQCLPKRCSPMCAIDDHTAAALAAAPRLSDGLNDSTPEVRKLRTLFIVAMPGLLMQFEAVDLERVDSSGRRTARRHPMQVIELRILAKREAGAAPGEVVLELGQRRKFG